MRTPELTLTYTLTIYVTPVPASYSAATYSTDAEVAGGDDDDGGSSVSSAGLSGGGAKNGPCYAVTIPHHPAKHVPCVYKSPTTAIAGACVGVFAVGLVGGGGALYMNNKVIPL